MPFRLVREDGRVVLEADHVEMWSCWPARIVSPPEDETALRRLYRDHRARTWFMKWYRPKGDHLDIPGSAMLCQGEQRLSPVGGLYLAAEWVKWDDPPIRQISLSRYSERMFTDLDAVSPVCGSHVDRRHQASIQKDSLGRQMLPLCPEEHVFVGYTDPRNPMEPLWTS